MSRSCPVGQPQALGTALAAPFPLFPAMTFSNLPGPADAALNLPGTPESYVVYLDNRGCIIRFEPRRGVKREQFVQDKPAMLSALLQWCESLPQRE